MLMCNGVLAGGYLHDKQVRLHNKSEGVLPYECWKTKDCTVGEYIASLRSEHEFLPRRRPAQCHPGFFSLESKRPTTSWFTSSPSAIIILND
jgi:hypothetical protein